jgi:hypothetical protein
LIKEYSACSETELWTSRSRVKGGSHERETFIMGRTSESEQLGVARGLASFWRYTAGLVEARTACPGDDFVSALVQARDAEGGVIEEGAGDRPPVARTSARPDSSFFHQTTSTVRQCGRG